MSLISCCYGMSLFGTDTSTHSRKQDVWVVLKVRQKVLKDSLMLVTVIFMAFKTFMRRLIAVGILIWGNACYFDPMSSVDSNG